MNQKDSFLSSISPEKQNEMLLSILKRVEVLIYVFSLEERKNLFVNHNITTKLGYEKEDIEQYGNEVLKIILHPNDFKAHSEMWTKYYALKDSDTISFITRYKHKRGHYLTYENTEQIFQRDPEGKAISILGVSRCIQDFIDRKDSIVNITNELNDMTDSISHELKHDQAKLSGLLSLDKTIRYEVLDKNQGLLKNLLQNFDNSILKLSKNILNLKERITNL